MVKLTKDDLEELSALAEVNGVTGKPSFIMRSHWHKSGYARLVRAGLVIWGNPPDGFDRRRFAGTTITLAGLLAIQSKEAGEP